MLEEEVLVLEEEVRGGGEEDLGVEDGSRCSRRRF